MVVIVAKIERVLFLGYFDRDSVGRLFAESEI